MVREEEVVKNNMKLNHYYGDLHCHTGFSDGCGTPAEAFKWAKENGVGDFLAVSDHSGSITKEKWIETLKAANECTDENFVALASYESGYSDEYTDEDGVQVVNGGELNVFQVDDLLVAAGYPESSEDFIEKLKSCGGIAFYNHPQEASWPTDKVWNAYDDFNGYNKEKDNLIVGVEVSNETSAYNAIHELVYTVALDKGWHFAPYSTSDTHSGKWHSGFNNRTVVLAESLTRENIYEAFKRRRVYAVEDFNYKINFNINGTLIGDTLDPSETKYSFNIHIEYKEKLAGNEIVLIQVISDYGQVVISKEVNDFNVQWNFNLESNDSRYYFVRVVNKNSKRAWTAPIWTGRAFDKLEKVKISKRIDNNTMKINYVSSEKDYSTKGANILDSNTKTYWETYEKQGEIVIDLGEIKTITGIGYRKNYIAYEDRVALAKLLDNYEYYISTDGKDFGECVAQGRVRNYGKEMYREIKETQGRYVKIKALNSIENSTVAIGNIYIYE